MLVGRNTGEEATIDHGPASRRDRLGAPIYWNPRKCWVCSGTEGGGRRCESKCGWVYGVDMLLEEGLPGRILNALHVFFLGEVVELEKGWLGGYVVVVRTYVMISCIYDRRVCFLGDPNVNSMAEKDKPRESLEEFIFQFNAPSASPKTGVGALHSQVELMIKFLGVAIIGNGLHIQQADQISK